MTSASCATAAEATQSQASEQAPFIAALTCFFDILLAFYHLAAFSGKDGDVHFTTAQQHLAAAQATAAPLDASAPSPQSTQLALVQYATALYALNANDVSAAQELLDTAYASLTGSQPGTTLA